MKIRLIVAILFGKLRNYSIFKLSDFKFILQCYIVLRNKYKQINIGLIMSLTTCFRTIKSHFYTSL